MDSICFVRKHQHGVAFVSNGMGQFVYQIKHAFLYAFESSFASEEAAVHVPGATCTPKQLVIFAAGEIPLACGQRWHSRFFAVRVNYRTEI